MNLFFEIFDYIKNIPNLPLLVLGFMLSVICTITDLKERKIYNSITGLGLLAGLALNYFLPNAGGLLFAFFGLLVGFGMFFPLYIVGACKAGDVKLSAALGACIGAWGIFIVVLFSLIWGGILSIIILMYKRKLISRLKMGMHLYNFIMLLFFSRKNAVRPDFENSIKIPLGITFLLGLITQFTLTNIYKLF